MPDTVAAVHRRYLLRHRCRIFAIFFPVVSRVIRCKPFSIYFIGLLKVQRKSPIKAAVHQVICSLKMIPVLNHEKEQQTHCGNSHIQVIIAAKI